jgi:uroporphyrinogen decarboxylase
MGIADSPFIRACYGRNDGRIPLWIMRQAGRYLPEYQAVREKVSFIELTKSPELIAEVVRQPIARFGLDAAILFSDILTMLEPMGARFDFPNGGPVLQKPIRNAADVGRLNRCDIKTDLSFVFDGIRRIKEILPTTPLIGFVGSPFTLASYLVEGSGSKTFNLAKRFLHEEPEASKRLFELLADTAAEYLDAQIHAGCDAVQVFDSWGGVLSREDYCDWSQTYLNRIFSRLRSKNVPRILFVNNLAPYLDIVNDIDCEVVGVDYRMDIGQAARALPNKAVQGNLDPSALYGPITKVVERTRRLLDSIEEPQRLIFNLGHGIQPDTPIASVEAVVATVHAYR